MGMAEILFGAPRKRETLANLRSLLQDIELNACATGGLAVELADRHEAALNGTGAAPDPREAIELLRNLVGVLGNLEELAVNVGEVLS